MQIKIPEPCTEDWSLMTPTEKGAHCKKCSFEVIDFTEKTPNEVRDILQFKFSKRERVCGRIQSSKLDLINAAFLRWEAESEVVRGTWILTLLIVFGLSLFSCQNTASRELVDQLQIEASTLLEEEAPIDTSNINNLRPAEISIDLKDGLAGVEGEDSLPAKDLVPLNEEIIGMEFMGMVVCGSFYPGGFPVEPGYGPDPYSFIESGVYPNVPVGIDLFVNRPGTRTPASPTQFILPEPPPFEAEVHPLPLQAMSRLCLSVFQASIFDISLLDAVGKEIFAQQLALSTGDHSIDFGADVLETGEYLLLVVDEFHAVELVVVG